MKWSKISLFPLVFFLLGIYWFFYLPFGSFRQITKEGFTALDSSIKKEVLVTGHVFCFLADSSMHAEVTNTPNPGTSLTPCRMCQLKVDRIAERKSLNYIRNFMMINPDGSEVCLNFQYHILFSLSFWILILISFGFEISADVKWKKLGWNTRKDLWAL